MLQVDLWEARLDLEIICWLLMNALGFEAPIWELALDAECHGMNDAGRGYDKPHTAFQHGLSEDI